MRQGGLVLYRVAAQLGLQSRGPSTPADLVFRRGAMCSGGRPAVTQVLHRRMLAHGGFAARGDILQDDTALIVTVASPDAWTVAGPKCTELFPLSRRVAAIRTALGEDRWQGDLCDWFAMDPSKAVFHLRRKRLVNDGACWVGAPGTGPWLRQLATRAEELSTRSGIK